MHDPRVRNRTSILDSTEENFVGQTVEQLSIFKTKSGDIVSFVTPSMAHLALDAAIISAKKANETRSTLQVSNPSRSPFAGPQTHYSDGDTPGALFDTFLHAMSSAILSYLAVENFANEVIGRHPENLISISEKPRKIVKGKKSEKRRFKTFSCMAREAERKSLSIKLTQVLPQITGLDLPKGRSPYQELNRLERVRDSIIHLKSRESSPRIQDLRHIPQSPLLTGFLLDDSLWMPSAAIGVIKHFAVESMPVDWLKDLENSLTS